MAQLSAHQIDSVEMRFRQEGGKWKLVGQLDVGYMLPEIRRVIEAPPVFREEVMNGSPEFHQRIVREAEETMRGLIVLRYNGEEVPWQIRFPDFEKQPLNLPVEAGDWALMQAEISLDARPGPGELSISWHDELKCELIIVHPKSADGKTPASTVPIASGMSATLLQVSATAAPPVTTTANKQAENWIISGYRHVIPLGLDHLLFIIGLFLLAPRWKPLLSQSLLFTLAHSLTLALCLTGAIALPSKWVEILIAASIAWIGIENLLLRELKPARLFLVFGFGLIHGMGFASVLREKITDLTGSQLALPLISFNIGVELAACFLLLLPLKKYTKPIQTSGSVIIALAGIFWIIQRL